MNVKLILVQIWETQVSDSGKDETPLFVTDIKNNINLRGNGEVSFPKQVVGTTVEGQEYLEYVRISVYTVVPRRPRCMYKIPNPLLSCLSVSLDRPQSHDKSLSQTRPWIQKTTGQVSHVEDYYDLNCFQVIKGDEPKVSEQKSVNKVYLLRCDTETFLPCQNTEIFLWRLSLVGTLWRLMSQPSFTNHSCTHFNIRPESFVKST